MGGRMRCEMSQKAMSLLPSERCEAAADGLGEDGEHGQRRHHGHQPGHAQGDGDEQAGHAADEQADDAQARPVTEAHQCVGRGRAQQHRHGGAGESDDDRVDVRPEGLRCLGHEHVLPGIEGRLEVDEGDVERTATHCVGVLNEVTNSQYSGNRTMNVQNTQHQPARELGQRRHVHRRAAAERDSSWFGRRLPVGGVSCAPAPRVAGPGCRMPWPRWSR